MLSNGKTLHFRFRLPTHLQYLSSGKAETYFRALGDSRLQLPSAMTENFTHSLHLGLHRWRPCTRSLHQGFRFAARRFEALRLKCEIHKVYGWHKSVLNQIAPILSKLKHLALALNSSDSMRSFWATLRTVGVLFALSPKLNAILQRLETQCCMLGPLHASNQRHCKASTGIDTVLGQWSMASSRQSGAPLHGVLHK